MTPACFARWVRLHSSTLKIPLAKTIAGLALLASSVYVVGAGCSDEIGVVVGDSSTTRGMALSMQIDEESAIDGMRFAIDRVDCADGALLEAEVHVHEGSLEDMTFPADIDPFLNRPYDARSEHHFADHFAVLPVGCYDVTATPLEQGEPSESCSPASAQRVRVFDGETTEILLISQCVGEETGALDVIASMNRPPYIEALAFNPSKFVAACEPAEVCVTATDPDRDPLELEWDLMGAPTSDTGEFVKVSSERLDEDSVRECIQIFGDAVGSYEYRVRAFDLLYDGDEELIRFEEFFAQLGENRMSRDTLTFPLYVTQSGNFCEAAPTVDAGAPTDTGAATDAGYAPDAAEQTDAEDACDPLTNRELRELINCTIDGGEATFTIPEGACPQQLSLSSYELPDGKVRPFDEQVLFDNVTDTYGPGTHNVEVDLPPACGYQTDLYTGAALAQLDPNHGHGNRILCWDVREDPSCAACLESCELERLESVRGPGYADVSVTIRCDEVEVSSSRDLSNVVLEFEDGSRQHFNGLSGTTGIFAGTNANAGKSIATVWVKSGLYLSGDGPGFGYRFDRASCDAL